MMKIKLAILDSDTDYLRRVAGAFSSYYADKLEVYSFTDAEAALAALIPNKIQVFLAARDTSPDLKRIPDACGFAYLVEMAGVDMLDNQAAVCKFQSAEMLYKQVLDIFSRSAKNLKIVPGSGGSRLILFSSPCGGAGTSTMAAGCAMYFAAQGKKALYLDLEVCGSAETYFHAAGTQNFGDVIYAAKSKGANLPLKIESCVRQDICGVYFFAPPEVALDVRDLRTEEAEQILNALQYSGDYDYIVADMDFSLEKERLALMQLADHVVWVSDGTERAAKKIERGLESLRLMDSAEQAAVGKLSLYYNRLRKNESHAAQPEKLRLNGKMQELDGGSEREVAAYMSGKKLFAPLTCE